LKWWKGRAFSGLEATRSRNAVVINQDLTVIGDVASAPISTARSLPLESSMSGLFGQNGRPTLLITTIKAAAAIAFLSVLAGHWLSDSLDATSLSRLAAQASRPGNEPTMTGSINRAAGAVKLDPCGPRKP
jgi:hypothetical protein